MPKVQEFLSELNVRSPPIAARQPRGKRAGRHSSGHPRCFRRKSEESSNIAMGFSTLCRATARFWVDRPTSRSQQPLLPCLRASTQIADPVKKKQWRDKLVDNINKAVDLPILNEEQEAVVIGFIVDALINNLTRPY